MRWVAISNGAISVEADVWLFDKTLYVSFLRPAMGLSGKLTALPGWSRYILSDGIPHF